MKRAMSGSDSCEDAYIVFSGSFIIVNDHLHDEFKQFSKNVSSYTNASYNMVKSNELIKIWL